MENGNIIKCILCNHFIRPNMGWTLGNNAQPLARGRCCNECNKLVIKERLRQHLMNTYENNEYYDYMMS